MQIKSSELIEERRKNTYKKKTKTNKMKREHGINGNKFKGTAKAMGE